MLYFTLQAVKGSYSTNIDYPLLMFLYKDDLSILEDNIDPDGTMDIVLPFYVDANLLWIYDNGISIEDFILVYTLYPTKNYVSF